MAPGTQVRVSIAPPSTRGLLAGDAYAAPAGAALRLSCAPSNTRLAVQTRRTTPRSSAGTSAALVTLIR